ncbi:hypothetical protein GCM10027614_54610 [Micromonospora vulcania]
MLVGGWTVAVTVATQAGGWLTDQVLLSFGRDRVGWLWPVLGLATVVLVGTPALLLALLPRSAAVRATGRAWLGATLALGVLTLLRIVPPVHHEAYLAVLASTTALTALVLRRWARRSASTGPFRAADGPEPAGGVREVRRPGPVPLLAIAAGLALLLPWAWLGALGGPLETALALLAAAALGVLAATLLDQTFWSTFAVGHPPRPARLVLVGGLVAGVALLLLAAGTGQSGAQLPALLTLPPVGFALAALRAATWRPAPAGAPDPADAVRAGRSAIGWLVGLTALGPLAFTDPEEITLLLVGTRDVPFWVATAAVAGLAVAVLVAIGYAVLLARPTARTPSRRVAALAAVVLLATVGVVDVGPGQPGLYGERLLVVLREQADLTGLPAGARAGPGGTPGRRRSTGGW